MAASAGAAPGQRAGARIAAIDSSSVEKRDACRLREEVDAKGDVRMLPEATHPKRLRAARYIPIHRRTDLTTRS